MKPIVSVDFLVITALEDERDALLGFLPMAQKQNPAEDDVRVYFHADVPTRFPDGNTAGYSVVITCQMGMGRVEGANCANDSIRRWHPRFIILVGIAGGIAESGVALGDVIVSDQVVDYELQKLTDKGPEVRYSVHRSDPRLLGAVLNLDVKDWRESVAKQRPEPGAPRRLVGPIATGDKVVAVKRLMQRYRRDWPKLIGVEMEAGGVASAAFQSPDKPGFLMVRGVSDLADEQKQAEPTRVWRGYAYRVAAAYALALIANGPVPKIEDKSITSEVNSAILNIEISETFEAEEEKLLHAAYPLLRAGYFPEELSVHFEVPIYRELVDRIREQTRVQRDLRIVSEQLAAIAEAEREMSSGEHWCSKLLIEIQRQYGIAEALKSCKRYIRYLLCHIIYRLAHYQTQDGPPICEDLIRSVDDLDSDFLPSIAWVAYQTSPLVQIEIATEPESKQTGIVVLPLNRIENTGTGGLVSDLWDSTEYIPVDVWCEYVVPQLAANAARIQSCCFWNREACHYQTLGHVYVAGKRYEYEKQRYVNSFEVAPRLRCKSLGNRT